MQAYDGLRAEAESFADQALTLLGDKPALVRFFFDRFPAVPRNMAALEFVGEGGRARQVAI